MKFEVPDCLAQRGIIDFDGVKVNMHACLILTQLKVKSNYSVDWFNMQNRSFTFQKFHLQHINWLFNMTNLLFFQAVAAVLIEKKLCTFVKEKGSFCSFCLFVCCCCCCMNVFMKHLLILLSHILSTWDMLCHCFYLFIRQSWHVIVKTSCCIADVDFSTIFFLSIF